jgi:hypothetical protein
MADKMQGFRVIGRSGPTVPYKGLWGIWVRGFGCGHYHTQPALTPVEGLILTEEHWNAGDIDLLERTDNATEPPHVVTPSGAIRVTFPDWDEESIALPPLSADEAALLESIKASEGAEIPREGGMGRWEDRVTGMPIPAKTVSTPDCRCAGPLYDPDTPCPVHPKVTVR